LEDPIAPELRSSFNWIRQHTTAPLANGKAFNSLWDAKELIKNQWIDYMRMTIVHGGGLTHV
jgi:mannonate dehydratase